MCTKANRLHNLARVIDAREHYDSDRRLKFAELLQGLQPIDPRHQ
jgi:hypothetical protein